MSYKHLSQTERYQIYVLMQAGKSLQAIAQMLGRHQSTISREVLRKALGAKKFISFETQKLHKLREQKSGLMHDLLSGKVSVKVEEPEVLDD